MKLIAILIGSLFLSYSGLAAPEDIKVDQVGYLPSERKLAMVTNAAATGGFALLRQSDGSAVFTGTLSATVDDGENSGDQIRYADFSSYTTPGTYVIQVDGLGSSYPFTIDVFAFQFAYKTLMAGFTGARCGTAVDLTAVWPGMKYDACHLGPSGFHATTTQRTDEATNEKGWHDAGDYGRYTVNAGYSTGLMMMAYELFQDRIKDVGLEIPEKANGVPDFLDEVRWNMEWLLGMQDSDGGAWHKQTSSDFCGFVMPSMDSSYPLFIGKYPNPGSPWKVTAATADLAACAARASTLFRPYDSVFADRCLSAARSAFTWIEANPSSNYETNPSDIGTGAYEDKDSNDERLWAATELFKATGEAQYSQYFFDNLNASISLSGGMGWQLVLPMAYWAYYYSGQPTVNTGTLSLIRARTLAAANSLTQTARLPMYGYRHQMSKGEYSWGSAGSVATKAVTLLVANQMQPNPDYVNAALDDLHYLLGRNTHSISFITRLGSKYPMAPHHRPSGADGIAEPWPGLVVGGPNKARQDSSVQALPTGLPPMKYYVDVEGSYSTNEPAINQSASVVFLLMGIQPVPTPIGTATHTGTPTHSPTITVTSTISPTFTHSPTYTETPTITQTHTISPTFTVSPTLTATPSITQTATITLTCTISPTATVTPTATPVPGALRQGPPDVVRLLFAPNPGRASGGKMCIDLEGPVDQVHLQVYSSALNLAWQKTWSGPLIGGWHCLDLGPTGLSGGVYFARVHAEKAGNTGRSVASPWYLVP
jgi:endoglucanase